MLNKKTINGVFAVVLLLSFFLPLIAQAEEESDETRRRAMEATFFLAELEKQAPDGSYAESATPPAYKNNDAADNAYSENPGTEEDNIVRANRSSNDYAVPYQERDVVYAKPLEKNKKEIPEEPKAKSRLEIGYEPSFVKYREPGVMREKGIMNGVSASYTYRNKFMVRGETKLSWGSMDYRNSGALDDIKDFMFELRGLYGYDFSPIEMYRITPYFGLGFRYLNDDMQGMTTSTGAAGYERESRYYYVPLGVEFMSRMANDWSFGLTGEYDFFLWGTQDSHLGTIPGYTDVTNNQKNGHGLRGSFRLQKNSRYIDFIVEPFIKYWSIKRSKESDFSWYGLSGSGVEPKNHSTEVGCKFAVGF